MLIYWALVSIMGWFSIALAAFNIGCIAVRRLWKTYRWWMYLPLLWDGLAGIALVVLSAIHLRY